MYINNRIYPKNGSIIVIGRYNNYVVNYYLTYHILTLSKPNHNMLIRRYESFGKWFNRYWVSILFLILEMKSITRTK